MKTLIQTLFVFACMAICPSVTSCSDDEATETTTYHMVFSEEKYNGDKPGVVALETRVINDAFLAELLEKSNTFMRVSSVNSSDKAVVDACLRAETALKGRSFLGHYVFVVHNVSKGTVLHTYVVN